MLSISREAFKRCQRKRKQKEGDEIKDETNMDETNANEVSGNFLLLRANFKFIKCRLIIETCDKPVYLV